MQKKNDSGILSKLSKVLFIQLIFISLATVGGVFGAAKVVEDVLIREALEGEAEFFWNHRVANPDFALPSTMNLTGYLVENNDYSAVPPEFRDMQSNYQRLPLNRKHPIVYLTERDGAQLFLVFEEAQVARLALFFGITPLAVVLLAIYLPAFMSYWLSKRAISPVLQLVGAIESVDTSKKQFTPPDLSEVKTTGNPEVATLVDTFIDYSQRMARFIARERNFSRYASHELRTPLTVLKGSLSLLEKHQLPHASARVVKRMQPMIDDMQSLIESLLLLSREQNIVLSEEAIVVNDLTRATARQTLRAFKDSGLQLNFTNRCVMQAHLPEQLFSVVITNLVRNACLYSEDGSAIDIEIGEGTVHITDYGKGMSDEQMQQIFEPFYRADEHGDARGFGLGLSIVNTICEQCGWQIEFKSKVAQGTTATLRLNQFEVIGSV